MPRVPEDERRYFYHRAEVQMELAERAETPEAVRAHVAIAEHYLHKCDAGAWLEAARATSDGTRPWRDAAE